MRRTFFIPASLCLVLLAFSNSAVAQDANGDAKQRQQVTPANLFGGLFGDSMQAQLTEMATKMIDGYLDYLAKPQTVKKLATFQKNYYDALIEQGFTKEQAFELVLRFGNPLQDGPHNGK
jgi:hypothetical protein